MVKEMGLVGFAQHSGGVGKYSDLGQILVSAAGIYASLTTLKVKMGALNMPVIRALWWIPFDKPPELNFNLILNIEDFHPSQFKCFLEGKKWCSNGRTMLFKSQVVNRLNLVALGLIARHPVFAKQTVFIGILSRFCVDKRWLVVRLKANEPVNRWIASILQEEIFY